jgi:hypothetical protein
MALPLRDDFDAPTVRLAAKIPKYGPQARRLLAVSAIYEGASRTEAAKIGGVTPQIIRDWVLKFNAHGPDGLIDRKPPGQAPRLNDAHRAALASIIESAPPARRPGGCLGNQPPLRRQSVERLARLTASSNMRQPKSLPSLRAASPPAPSTAPPRSIRAGKNGPSPSKLGRRQRRSRSW